MSKSHENRRFRLPHCRLTPPLQRTPANIRTNFMSPETRLNCLHFLVANSMGLSSFIFCGGLRKTHLLFNRMRNRLRIGRSRSSKVVDFGTNRKGVCDFLLVINSNFGPILNRFWDTATYWLKIANFFLHHSHLMPSLGSRGWTLSNFWMNFLSQKLESLGYSSVKISWS